mmetsp:Transcript_35411/g.80882  ORF Transcript_35411/g.80882 Transcript_35411/m.80882 type:complete len:108 (+) Transcript_35411:962-1285(+)
MLAGSGGQLASGSAILAADTGGHVAAGKSPVTGIGAEDTGVQVPETGAHEAADNGAWAPVGMQLGTAVDRLGPVAADTLAVASAEGARAVSAVGTQAAVAAEIQQTA